MVCAMVRVCSRLYGCMVYSSVIICQLRIRLNQEQDGEDTQSAVMELAEEPVFPDDERDPGETCTYKCKKYTCYMYDSYMYMYLVIQSRSMKCMVHQGITQPHI